MKQTCSTCKYCDENELKDLICVNADSEYCSDYVEEKHTCENWEGK